MIELINESVFLNNWGIFSVGSWQVPRIGLLIFSISTVLILILNLFLKKFVSKKRANSGEIDNIYNSIYFFQRLIVAIIIIILSVNFLNIKSDYVTIISSIIITAVMFASVKALNNFVAGIYITLTRPFVIGDFINVGGVEGLVMEITLNYIKIRHKDASVTSIPNLKCLDSKIINYTLSITSFQKRVAQLEKNIMVKNLRLLKDSNPKLKRTLRNMDEELIDMNKTLEEVKVFRHNYLIKLDKEKENLEQHREQIIQNAKDKLEQEMKETFSMVKNFFDRKDEKEKSYRENIKHIENDIPKSKFRKNKINLNKNKVSENAIKHNLETLNDAKKESNDKFNQDDQILVKKKFAQLQESISKDKEENLGKEMKTKGMKKVDNKPQLPPHEYSPYVDEDKIIRYTFILSLEKKHSRNAKCLDEVCERWQDEFEVTPSWCVTGLGGRIDYQFTIITPDPYDIIHYFDEFVKDVYTTVYTQ